VGYDEPNTVMVIGSPALRRGGDLLGAQGLDDQDSATPEMVHFASLTPVKSEEEYLVDWGRRRGDPPSQERPKVYTVVDLHRIADDVRKFIAAREAASEPERKG
jgi:hypothetical protein